MKNHVTIAALAGAVLACGTTAWAGIVMETVTIGNPGNEGELSGTSAGGFGPDGIVGGVDYVYSIGKYEVTAGQYTEFLNAVAAADPHELYHPSMWSSDYGAKIQRSGSPGSYTYSVAAEWRDRPVNLASFWDASRFANWMHNGQPTGAQGPTTTEDGSYTLNGYTGPDGSWITRNPNATWVIPSEDEWYKAAYHKNDGVTANYWDYPTGSDAVSSNDLIEPDPGNNANYWIPDDDYTIGGPFWRTDVGEFESSASPYGTYDQGGNVWEWNEGLFPTTDRGLRGSSYLDFDNNLRSAGRGHVGPSFQDTVRGNVGFRVTFIPEPATLSLLLLGGMTALKRRQRR